MKLVQFWVEDETKEQMEELRITKSINWSNFLRNSTKEKIEELATSIFFTSKNTTKTS